MSDSEDDAVQDRLVVNKAFARKFNEQNRQAELRRAEQTGLLRGDADSDSDDSEDEDDHGEALTAKLDFDIMKTISMIHNKDKRIYDENFKPFDGADKSEQNDSDSSDEEDGASKAKKNKPMRYKDLVRAQVLKQAEEGGDAAQVFEDSDDEDGGKNRRKGKFAEESGESVPVYDEQQRRLKEAFKAQADDEDESEEEDDEDDEDKDVLRKKVKSKEELEAEENNFNKYMSSLAKQDPRMRKARKEDVEMLETFFKEPAKDKDEAFLRKFFLNQAWTDQEGLEASRQNALDDEDEDEEALDEADRFEAKYNFRHEEPGAGELGSTQVDPNSTIRRKESSRRRQREAKRQRKQEEKEKRKEELRRLKNLKRKELEKRLEKSIRMAGLNEDAEIGLKPEDLEGDFDPEEFDRRMAQIFNDDYYDQDDDGFEATGDVAAEEEMFGKGDDEEDEDEEQKKDSDSDSDSDSDDEDEGVKIVDRAEDDPSTQAAAEDEKQKRRKKKGKEEELKSISVKDLKDKVINEQLYKMDYDDVIGGDIKTRFKYRKVTPNSYGLSTEEILFADEDLLNSFVSIKKLAPYEENEWHASTKHRKRFRKALKDRIEGVTEMKEKKTKRDRKRAKLEKLKAKQEALEESQEEEDDNEETESTQKGDKKKKDKKEKKEDNEDGSKKKRKRKRKNKNGDAGEGENEEENKQIEEKPEDNAEGEDGQKKKRKRKRKNKTAENDDE